MTEKLLEGLILMIIGMGVVVCFLYVMILVMMIMTKVVGYLNKLFPVQTEEIVTKTKKISQNVDEAIALALAAVVARKN